MAGIRSIVPVGLLFLIVFLSACGKKESADVPGQKEAPAAAQPAPAPAAQSAQKEKAPVPISMSEEMWRRVDAGEWTLEEGLVAGLKVLTKERPAEKVYGAGRVPKSGSEGILRAARAYLKTGTDDKAKAEIRQLLEHLIPDKEAIERESAPAPSPPAGNQSSLERQGWLEWFPAAHADTSPCDALWRGGASRRSSRTSACAHVVEWTSGGQRMRIFYPAEWDDTGDRRLRYVALTRDAMDRSHETYRRWGRMRRVDTVLGIGRNDGTETAADASVNSLGECDVLVWSSALQPHDEPYYVQVLAHELFHCYQGWNLDRQYSGDGSARWYSITEWWAEGTADYFGNVVYPTINAEHQFAPDFDNHSLRTPLLNLSYASCFFFQYLGNRVGDPQIIEYLRHLPTSGGRREQARALGRWDNMQEIFEAFGQAYFDHQIRDTGGGIIPLNPVPGTNTTIRAPGNYRFNTNEFVLFRELLAFDGDGLELRKSTTGPPGRESARDTPDGTEWRPLPERVGEGGCEEEARDQLLLVTSASGQVGEHSLQLNVTSGASAADAGPAPGAIDECLVGRWVVKPESARAAAQAMLRFHDASDRSRLDSATVQHDFCLTANGHASGSVNMNVRTSTDIGGARMHTIFEIASSGTASYIAEGGRLKYIDGREAVSQNMTASVEGTTVDIPTPVPDARRQGVMFGDLSYFYQCRGSDLSLRIDYPGATDVDYRRVSPR